MIHPTRVLQLAKEKSQQLLSLDSEKFTSKLDKLLSVYHGYSKLKPKIFPKRMSAMFPSHVVVEDSDDSTHRHFHPGFGSTASLKRHQMDWSEKYQRTRPGYAEDTTAGREETDHSRRVQIGTSREERDRRKSYTGSTVGRGRNPHARSTRRVVLQETNAPKSSANILCSSVVFTYREGLFYDEQHTRAYCDRNCTDV